MKRNMINQILFIVLVLASSVGYAQSDPVVSNVTFAQRTDGSLKVDVYYDVFDADSDTLYVTLQASSDNGATWALPVSNVTGAVGSNILSGTNKQIAWNFGQERPNYFNDQVKIKVVATDIKCLGLTIEYGGKTYTTVQIGTQCWLKQNLNIGVMLPNDSTNSSNNGIIEKYCYVNNPTHCDDYGGFYQWHEAMQYVTMPGARGICPAGWHIPTKTELQILSLTVNSNSNSLKAVGVGRGSGAGTNSSGFTALLSGHRGQYGDFGWLSYREYFWTSTEASPLSGYLIEINDYNSSIDNYERAKNFGYSIRCLKD